MRRWLHAVAVALTTVCIGSVVAGSVVRATPDRPQPTLAFIPAEVIVAATGPTEVLLVIENPTPAVIDAPALEVIAPDGVAFELETTEVAQIDSGKNLIRSGKISLRPDEGSFASGSIIVTATFDDSATSVAAVAVTRSADAVTSLVGVSLTGPSESVSELRTGNIYVEIHNNVGAPVHITCVVWEAPPGVTVQPRDGWSHPTNPSDCTPASPSSGDEQDAVTVTLGAAQTVLLPYRASASKLNPGRDQLLVAVDVRTADGDRSERVWAVAAFETSVFGVTQLTALFGVPIFLLLPGFLMEALFAFVRRAKGRDDEGKVWANPKSVDGLLIALGISLVVLALFHFVAPVLGFDWSYIVRYGWAEIVRVLLPSGLLGAGLGWITAKLQIDAETAAQADVDKHTPPETTDAHELIRFLADTEQPIDLDALSVAGDEYVLTFAGLAPEGQSWYTSHIVLAPDDENDAYFEFLGELDSVMTAADLVRLLDDTLASGAVVVTPTFHGALGQPGTFCQKTISGAPLSKRRLVYTN